MITATRPTLQLRPYQEEAIEAVNDAVMDGIKRPLVALPTGTGKTVIFANLIDQRPGRSLVLAHRDELIRQAADKLLMVNPGLDIGVVKAGENETGAPVVVASVQTLSRERRLSQLLCDFNAIVVDEAHHAVAPTYHRILEHVGSFADDAPLTVGFTATPERGDKAGLGNVWDRIVYQKSILEMMLAGYLRDLRAIQIALQVDLDQLHIRHGDFVDSELEAAMTQANAPAHVVGAYQEHAANRKALVFTPTVQLAHTMAGAFRQAGVKAEALDGTTPDDERRAILRRLHTGGTLVVANCAVLTEGFDEPSVDCLIIARPTKSKPLYIQMLGRGTRVYPGKGDLLVLAAVGASTRHSIMTATELFGLGLENMSVKEAAEERQEGLATGKYVYNQDGDLVSNPVNLFRTRPMHWVETQKGRWVLSLGDRVQLRLVPTPSAGSGQALTGQWTVVRSADRTKKTLYAALPLEYAMGAAEDYAREYGSWALLDAAAGWRTSAEPVTPGQISFMRKVGLPVMPGLTKVRASDMLLAVTGDWD